MMKWRTFAGMLTAALGLGLLEAAWTTPSAPGATYAGLGNFAIAMVLWVVCWPRIWWILGLSVLEEGTQVFVGSHFAWHPNYNWFFHHWSAGYFGINLYPMLTFPFITLIAEGVYLYVMRKRSASEADLVQSGHEPGSPDRA